MDDELTERRRRLRDASQMLSGHGVPDAAKELARVSQWCVDQGVTQDVYGAGELIQAFEGKLASLFGTEAARFLPSGTMAQGIAMRVWGGEGGHIGLHPTSHLELHEELGYSHVFGLRATLVGSTDRVMLAEDVEAIDEVLDALIIELPTCENGGQLPSWDDLVHLCDSARDAGTRVHLDGARIWEAQAAYGRPFDEIGQLFDSVYVSFYKGMGALPGAMLLGPGALIEEAAVWQRRLGGNLYTMLPSVASAASRFDARLPRFGLYYQRARTLAAALADIDGVTVVPNPPHVGMMHVALDIDPEIAALARDRVADEQGIWLFGGVPKATEGHRSSFEVTVGEAAMELSDEDVAEALRLLLS